MSTGPTCPHPADHRANEPGDPAMTSTRALNAAGQSLWLDNITRPMLDDGTLAGYIDELSVTGPDLEPDDLRQGDRPARRLRRPDRRGRREPGLARRGGLLRARDRRPAPRRRRVRRGARAHARTSTASSRSRSRPELASTTPARRSRRRATCTTRMERPNVFIKIPGTPRGPAGDRGGDLRRHPGQRHAAVLQRAAPRRRRRLDDAASSAASPTACRRTSRRSRRSS